MSSKQAIAFMLVILLCVLLAPHTSRAADWNVSPFRAQLANAPADQTAGGGDSVVAFNPLKKNIGKGVLFSLIIPGAGQLYSGSWLRAVPWFAVEVAGWAYFATYHSRGQDKTTAFEAYAGPRDDPNHFRTNDYLYHEWQVSQDDVANGAAPPNTTISQGDWRTTDWDTRSTYLPPPFTHDVMTFDRQQYFEMIGKYLSQFGWGWEDTHTGSGDGSNWAVTADPSIAADDASTVEFDGGSPMFFHYRDMRGRANDLLDKGNAAMEVVLVNHVLSALDAAFAVRSYNKRVSPVPTPDLGNIHLRYDVQADANLQPVRMLKLSIPLD